MVAILGQRQTIDHTWHRQVYIHVIMVYVLALKNALLFYGKTTLNIRHKVETQIQSYFHRWERKEPRHLGITPLTEVFFRIVLLLGFLGLTNGPESFQY